MDFSIFDLVNWPYPDEKCEGSLQRSVYEKHLEEWKHAEELGFETIWLTEHHFTNYNMMPSPNIMMATLAERTETIKIGAMINAVNFHDPWRLAEESAMLDILMDGRLVLGLGRSADVQEYKKFGQPLEEGRPRFKEGLELMKKALSGDKVEFEGDFFEIHGGTIRPRPLQDPYPPIYVTCISPETHLWAAQEGYPISSIFLTPEQTSYSYDLYQSARSYAGKTMDPSDFLLCRNVYVGDSKEQALEEAREPILHFLRLFQNAAVPEDKEELETGPENFQYYTEFFEPFFGDTMTYEGLVDSGIVIVGDPEEVVDEIKRQQEIIGMDHLMCCMAFGNLSHDKVMSSMRRFGQEVMPQIL